MAARGELERLFPLHWRELCPDPSRAPLSPDWLAYERLEKAGAMLFVTLRDAGRLVGYFVGFVMPHLHYASNTVLTNDIFWTHPDIRGGVAGLRLFRAVDREARSRGVSWIECESKHHFDAGRMLKAIGYKAIGTVWRKWIR